ncbi:MAG: DUF3427 domain-containing protein [Flavobacterium sp.]|nr:DUF3427 domain-containing protein [Flavobacterium sp.]
MQFGLYEQLINKLIASKLESLDENKFYIKKIEVDKSEASRILSLYLAATIEQILNHYIGIDSVQKQIELANKIITYLGEEIQSTDFDKNLVLTEGRLLVALFSKIDPPFVDLQKYLKEVTPYTRLTQSELFTGSNSGISLESEIKKEILSSNKIKFLVSFIKWTGIRIFEKELENFTERGGELRIITTSYLGATDLKAIEYLSKLKNTEIKISYNTKNERLHAKAYLFIRDTGFHTGYIGSSNLSRSALTSGLEWNLKITTKEISHIIDKFQKTFDTYWLDSEFEVFDANNDSEKLRKALKDQKRTNHSESSNYFDVKPYPFQSEILEKLMTERLVHNRFKNLIVAATGTGKTIISAFDYQRFKKENPSFKLLFLTHRKEILLQAQATFRGILRDNNFGDLWVDGEEPNSYNFVFASVQTLKNRLENLNLSPEFYDYIIVDEVHHISAASYRPILNHFKPQILLGLTATPERMDEEDILLDFCNTIAAEIRLPEALNRKLLCPFQYFGITDSVQLVNVEWKNGRYAPSELNKLYTENPKRIGEIIFSLNKYLKDINEVRALGFCVSQEHAKYMSEQFQSAGLKSDYLVAETSELRAQLRESLVLKTINYLFVVDMFNEGVDLPDIDTVLFLRPTESVTIFLQQLGRGLRLSEGKECLTVLDFVGNSRPEYDFEGKFRALVGKTNTPILKEIEDDFPHLPLGCSIILEKKSKEYILQNVKEAISFSKRKLVNKIRNFRHQTHLPLTLNNFIKFYHIPLQYIYKRGGWKYLCFLAGEIREYPSVNSNEIVSAISNKWLATKSTSYFKFILHLTNLKFDIKISKLSEEYQHMCLMLHYDIWPSSDKFLGIEESIKSIGDNEVLVEEIVEVLNILLERIDFIEHNITLPFVQPLKMHSRYTRDQILAAFGFSTFNKKSEIREGVAFSPTKNVELLFITLAKSEEEFSPTTLYDDFAISDRIFHWQTQNVVDSNTEKGLSYINHQHNNKRILLFVRERNKDEYGNTMGSVFLGEGKLIDYYGAKPMSIKWELEEPMPAYIWKDSAKMAVG